MSKETVSRGKSKAITIGLSAVIVAVTHETPRVLTVRHPAGDTPEPFEPRLPFGRLDPEGDRTLELALRGWVQEQTGLHLGYAEQLYTFGDRDRDPGRRLGEARTISVAYLALVREIVPTGEGAKWRDCYDFFPWEDWRDGRPPILDHQLLPSLEQWAASDSNPRSARHRRERIDIVFGCGGSSWDVERSLDRYELLYEAGLVAECSRDQEGVGHILGEPLGEPMALDGRRILATAIGRLRGKLKYRPLVFELLPETFTLLQLQRLVEALTGLHLHKQNFRRLLERGGLVEGTGRLQRQGRGRPAELFSFRREVLRERPAPGVGLPGVP